MGGGGRDVDKVGVEEKEGEGVRRREGGRDVDRGGCGREGGRRVGEEERGREGCGQRWVWKRKAEMEGKWVDMRKRDWKEEKDYEARVKVGGQWTGKGVD